MSAVLSFPKALAPAARAPGGVPLELRGVVRRFGERRVLASLDLDIAPGEFVALVGRSGCGKSTLLRLLAGLDRPDGGRLQVGGAALDGPHADIRILFQEARLLPWKRVIDNVGLGLAGRGWRQRAAHWLDQVGLGDRAGEWPAVLSGGQRQRVALARALIHEPQLLLLDEPFGALDALTRIEMQRLVERLWRARGFTTVLVTHDVGEAVALADRVILLEDGGVGLDRAIALPRPRGRGQAAFARAEGEVLARVMGE
ncbi:ATP-binding cassette domain-containing protein [Plasticicumulans acidivorans]|uniref:Sulfonate transport system ATP-binding protein n=1 Tax=Plasticicumulans acidivorans TaxID=886464 RepID=A0A317N170_9GAMM|nr:ATP-binding cassette domain-containing protein [Plasticicumulans acidivorans]PWV65668.1 sulfonate transport system ATP-binding protein [Plasticicumulans acidivorans]